MRICTRNQMHVICIERQLSTSSPSFECVFRLNTLAAHNTYINTIDYCASLLPNYCQSKSNAVRSTRPKHIANGLQQWFSTSCVGRTLERVTSDDTDPEFIFWSQDGFNRGSASMPCTTAD